MTLEVPYADMNKEACPKPTEVDTNHSSVHSSTLTK